MKVFFFCKTKQGVFFFFQFWQLRSFDFKFLLFNEYINQKGINICVISSSFIMQNNYFVRCIFLIFFFEIYIVVCFSFQFSGMEQDNLIRLHTNLNVRIIFLQFI